MDPASMGIGVVSGAAALAAMAVQTTTYLVGLKDTLQRADLIFLDLLTSCQAFEAAWSHIHEWAKTQSSRSKGSTMVLEKLSAYLESSKTMLDTLQADLERFRSKSKSSWRSMSRKVVLLHEKILRDHCDRMHRQTSSLHLLLSTARLPSIEMQDILVDVFQPVFRKDEETAWTIVKSKQSTRPAPSTRYSDSVRNVLQRHDAVENVHRRFTFENDLFLAPVYKRLLLRSLSAPDLFDGHTDYSSLQESASILTREPNDKDFGKGPDLRIDDASSGAQSSPSDDFDLTPKNIVNSLRSAGRFSMGVQVDLAEMQLTTGAFNLPKRSLPLHSALKQAQMEPNEQLRLNNRLIQSAHVEDMSAVAQALDDGADINAVDEGGMSALDICLDKWRSTDIWKEANIAHLLLLYRETAIRSKGKASASLLHLAILSGDVAMVACLTQDLTDSLRLFLQSGLSPLYIAPAFSHEDLAPFREINRILASNQINPDTVPGYEGKSALHLAAVEGDTEHGAKLVSLGCNPYAPMDRTSHNNDGEDCRSSAVFLALKLGHTDFVLKVVDVYLTKRVAPPDVVGHDETLKLVRVGEQQGYPHIAEMLLQKWLDWHIEKGVIDNLYSSLVSSDATQDHAALFLMLVSQGKLPLSESPLDITALVPHIWAMCDEDWAISVFQGINTTAAPGFVYRITGTVAPEATDETMHDLEDLLVQILYTCGHSWAHSSRQEVREPEGFVSPPTDELSATRFRRLLGRGSLFTWKGVRATTPTEEELYYLVENDPTNRWLKRIYFIPNAEGQPKFVNTARGVLSTYVEWRNPAREHDQIG